MLIFTCGGCRKTWLLHGLRTQTDTGGCGLAMDGLLLQI